MSHSILPMNNIMQKSINKRFPSEWCSSTLYASHHNKVMMGGTEECRVVWAEEGAADNVVPNNCG